MSAPPAPASTRPPPRARRAASPIRIAADRPSPFLQYAAGLASDFLGVELDLAEPGAGPDPTHVYYGDDASRPCAFRIPRVERYRVGDVPGLPGAAEAPRPGRDAFPFDLFTAVRFWIADEGNAEVPDDAYDRHGRIAAKRSCQGQRGLLEVPVVNAYLALFGAWLAERAGAQPQSPLPAGKRCTVVLSHDVDDPCDPHDVGRSLRMIALSARSGGLRRCYHYSRSLPRTVLGRLRRPEDRHWLFSEIANAEARHGFQSTFFFAVHPHYRRGGSFFDVDYDVRDPRFADAFRGIVKPGGEIGLHISYNAHRSAERVAAEKRLLEEVCGSEVRGSRHHYWHMGRPFWETLAHHARAQLRYDASTAFNEAPGYRLGIAFPFHPWSPPEQGAIATLQIPTLGMDSPICKPTTRPAAGAGQAELSVGDVVKRFCELLDGLKAHSGVAAIDWHARTSYPASAQHGKRGEAYLEILKALEADAEVDVANGSAVLERFGAGRTASFADRAGP